EEQVTSVALEDGYVVRLAVKADGCDAAVGVGDAAGGQENGSADEGGIGRWGDGGDGRELLGGDDGERAGETVVGLVVLEGDAAEVVTLEGQRVDAGGD